MLRVFLTLALFNLADGTETSDKPPVEIEPQKQIIENQPVVETLSPCCLNLNNYCKRRGRECEDYIQPPYLLHNCRCVVTIQQQYERLKQQCVREAIEFSMKRMEIKASREILKNLPSQSNGRYPGPAAEVGAKGPAGRGKVSLSEAYLQQKLQRLQNKNAENSQQSVATSANAYTAVTTASTIGSNTIERAAYTGNRGSNGDYGPSGSGNIQTVRNGNYNDDFGNDYNTVGNILDSMPYMKK